MKIAIIADHGNSLAIWNCMKLHIDLIIRSDYVVEIYIDKACDESLIQDEYKKYCFYYKDAKELSHHLKHRKDIRYLWVPSFMSFIRIYRLHLNIPFLYWVQGDVPDESFLRHHSYIRKFVLLVLEYFAFKYSYGLVFVSDSMRDFYDKKYGLKNKLSIVLPCLSEFAYIDSLQRERRKNSFVYIGSLSKWQCLDKVLLIYKEISTPESVFHIITQDVVEAKDLVSKYLPNYKNIEIYPINDRKQIPFVLSEFEYGFLIREESPVNYVSSPIKFLEYISCGVNVIMTSAVPSYAKIVEEYKIGTIVNLKDITSIKLRPYSSAAQDVYKNLFIPDKYSLLYSELLG